MHVGSLVGTAPLVRGVLRGGGRVVPCGMGAGGVIPWSPLATEGSPAVALLVRLGRWAGGGSRVFVFVGRVLVTYLDVVRLCLGIHV